MSVSKNKPHFGSKVWSMIKNAFNVLMVARQRSVNMKLAEMIQRTEYRNESVYTVFKAIENGDLVRLNKNVR